MRSTLIACALLFALLVSPTAAPAACGLSACPFDSAGSHDGTDAGSLILTPSAGTLGRGQGMIGLAMEHQRYNASPADDAHELHEQGRHVHGKNHDETYSVRAAYGVTDQWDAVLVVPYVRRATIQVEDHEMLGRGERSEGLGDVMLGAKMQVLRAPVRAALFASVEPPTGAQSERDQSDAKFGAELQPGSGSWDAAAGAAVGGMVWSGWRWGAAMQYRAHGTGAQQVRVGNVLRCDLGVASPRCRPARRVAAGPVLELQAQWADRDREHGEPVLDSGGTTVLLSPGVTASFERVSVFLAVPVPVYQGLGGEHEELTYEVVTGVSWRF